MIHVDYEVKTKQGNRESMHVPDQKIRDVDGNIMIIEGPNSSGKSTLMNLIAIGAYGEDDESLSQSMRSNLQELTESSYRDISFDIIIKDPKSGHELQFVRKSGSTENVVLEDGEPLNKQQFRQKYNLIYDIPEDPTARLKDISKMIRDDHRMLQQRVSDFNSYVNGIWASISGKPTEKEIKHIKKEIIGAEEELKVLNSKSSDGDKVSKINQIIKIRTYLELEKKSNELQIKIDSEKKKPTADVTETQYRNNYNKYIESLESIQPRGRSNAEITENPQIVQAYDNVERMWASVNVKDLSQTSATLSDYLTAVMNMLNIIPDTTEEAANLEIVNKAIEAISRINENEKIGNIGSISDILQALNEYKRGFADQRIINAYVKLKSEMSKIKNSIPNLIMRADHLSKVTRSGSTSQYRDEDRIQTLTNDLEKILTSMKKAESELKANGVIPSQAEFKRLCEEFSVSTSVTQDEIERVASAYSDEAAKTQRDKERLSKYISSQKSIVEQYENGEKPAYQDDRDKVKLVLNAIRGIRGRISTANERLDNIEKNIRDDYDNNPKLYDPIWEYIGHRLGTVRDKGREYNVKSVNLLIESKGLITTEDGVEIHIGAMGTGEGQLSYIRGLLSNEDGRMMIVLLDEIGNMSNANVELVIERMKEIQSDGRLMAGVMVRPGDVLEVTTYGL